MTLALALAHEAELRPLLLGTLGDSRYRHWADVGRYWQLKLALAESTWDELQMVSIGNGKVLGYLEAHFDRPAGCVSSLGIANLTEQPSLVFGRDVVRFMRTLLVDHGQHAVRWTVTCGNPAEKMYDRLVDRYGGAIVGVERGAVVLLDGSRCDRKRYELLASEWPRHASDRGRGER